MRGRILTPKQKYARLLATVRNLGGRRRHRDVHIVSLQTYFSGVYSAKIKGAALISVRAQIAAIERDPKHDKRGKLVLLGLLKNEINVPVIQQDLAEAISRVSQSLAREESKMVAFSL